MHISSHLSPLTPVVVGAPQMTLGERGGSVVECRTPEREVRGSRPTTAVLCPWARHFTPRKYWLITQEVMASSRHDWKIVDWDVKPQQNQPTKDDVATIYMSTFPFLPLPSSFHLFFCLHLIHAPFTVLCKIVFTILRCGHTSWVSFCFITMVRRSSCTPIAFWILLRTSSFVTWSL